MDLVLVGVFTAAVVFDDGEVQVHAHGIARGAGEVALVAEQGSLFDENLTCAGREVIGDQVIPVFVGQMRVVGPDLGAGAEGVGGDADDDGGFPIGLTGEVAVVGGVHGSHAGFGAGEDVDALVTVTGLEGVVP